MRPASDAERHEVSCHVLRFSRGLLDHARVDRALLTTFARTHLAAIGYPAPRTVSKLEDTVFCF